MQLTIPKPSNKEVEKYLKKWDGLENYVLQESSLKKLFTKTYPDNTDLNDVLIKVCTLNDFYSTNIFSPFTVAKHIKKLNIDPALSNEDLSLVDKIANIQMNNGKNKYFYSFASKYCSHHRPEVYPIYDSYVGKVLLFFKNKDDFYYFSSRDLKNYKKFKEIILAFKSFYNINKYEIRDIDRYLWQIGKELFPKNY